MMNIAFDTILASHFSNMKDITDIEAQMMNELSTVCYKRDESCYGSCLDWRQICNGIVDCNDSQDEVSCDLLEFNDCRVDEYRCRSGHCIPLVFAFDKTLDCADGSDEENSFVIALDLDNCYRKVPNMFCDEFNNAWMRFPCGDGYSLKSLFYDCQDKRPPSHSKTVIYR